MHRHVQQIGLLSPAERSHNLGGYRRYGQLISHLSAMCYCRKSGAVAIFSFQVIDKQGYIVRRNSNVCLGGLAASVL